MSSVLWRVLEFLFLPKSSKMVLRVLVLAKPSLISLVTDVRILCYELHSYIILCMHAGTLFSSMMFPDRAPNDVYLYTTFIGGSRNKELAKASRCMIFCISSFSTGTFVIFPLELTGVSFYFFEYRDELKHMVTSDLRQLLGAEGEPAFVKYCIVLISTQYHYKFSHIVHIVKDPNHYMFLHIFCLLSHLYWSKAFPLYGLNYQSVVDAIDRLEKNLPGFFYAGFASSSNYLPLLPPFILVN